MTCPHYTPGQLVRFPPTPCGPCGGWVDADGTVMDRATTTARYPMMEAIIAGDPRAPDTLHRVLNPTGADKAAAAVGLLGKLATSGLAIIFAGLALALLIFLLVKLV